MSKRKPTAPEGIRRRHSVGCPARDGARCSCKAGWEASVFSRREGKKLRKSFPTLAAAKSWRADKLAEANRKVLRAPSRRTVSEAAEEFMQGAREGAVTTRSHGRYKAATLRGYRQALDLRILPELGYLRLSEVERRHLQALADRLLADGFSASSVHNTLDPLRAIYRRAINRDEVSHNPTTGLELRRPDGRRDRIASVEEAAALIAALPTDEQAVWACAFYAGLRRGELQALRWSDVDLARRVIHVQRGWDAVEGAQAGKTAAADRRVPILATLAPRLVAHKLATGRDGEALVFGRTSAEPFVPSTARNRALSAWKKAKLDPITLHEARHTCASLFIAAGTNAKALTAIMGHATITMTFDTYGHLMPGGLDEAREAGNAYIARLAGGRRLTAVAT